MVFLILGFFASVVIATAPILWAQEYCTQIAMWGSEGERQGQFSGLNDVIFTGQFVYVPDYENHRFSLLLV